MQKDLFVWLSRIYAWFTAALVLALRFGALVAYSVVGWGRQMTPAYIYVRSTGRGIENISVKRHDIDAIRLIVLGGSPDPPDCLRLLEKRYLVQSAINIEDKIILHRGNLPDIFGDSV
jgi:hypothetical protein